MYADWLAENGSLQDRFTVRWTAVLYNNFLLATGYMNDMDYFLCPAYGDSEDVDNYGCTFSPNIALFAAGSTDRYPSALWIGDGYGPMRIRCKDWSMRWRHGNAKSNVYNGQDTLGYDTTVGTANFLYGDGSVQSRNANAREQVCREEIVYMGRGEQRGVLYYKEDTDHTNCGGEFSSTSM